MLIWKKISVTSGDLMQYIESLPYILDEPEADPAPINAMMIAGKAIDCGYKVLLSGAGGDDFFSGYRRHIALEYDKKNDEAACCNKKIYRICV